MLASNAYLEEGAVIAPGVPGHTPVASPENHAVVGVQPLVAGDGLHQAFLNCEQGCLGWDHSEPAGYPANMGINWKGGDGKAFRHYDIGDFPADPGEGGKLFECPRNLTVEVGDELSGAVNQVFGFVVVEPQLLNIWFDFIWFSRCQIPGRWVTGKQGGGQVINRLVR